MSPLQALLHPWILEGLPNKVLDHHKKMFNQENDPKFIFKMTHQDIQGFPTNAQGQSIYEIIEEIKQDDLLREIERKQRKFLQERDDSPSHQGGHRQDKTSISIKTINLSVNSKPSKKEQEEASNKEDYGFKAINMMPGSKGVRSIQKTSALNSCREVLVQDPNFEC
jgi:hypothetical protein